MTSIGDVCSFLDEFAPQQLAEEWDNVGLLVGDPDRAVTKLMTCLTVTPDSGQEALQERAELIVTHHPLPFRATKRVTTETVSGRLLWQLIGGQVSVYSPHTAFDSAALGINRRLAEGLQLSDIQPLLPAEEGSAVGAGRQGRLAPALPLAAVARRLKELLGIDGLHAVGAAERPVERVAVACGSAGGFLEAARAAACDLLVTGETGFHTCLEAAATGVALLLPGHFASERFAVEQLAGVLGERFPELTVWASRREHDPLRWE